MQSNSSNHCSGQQVSDQAQALACAINIISRREHAVKELEQKLARRDFLAEDISYAIQYCLENNYLNDERFAQVYMRAKSARGQGLSRIANELKLKGIDADTVALANLENQIDWFELAENVYQRKFGSTSVNDFRTKQKVQRYLYSRGFSSEQIRYAMKPS